MRKVLMAVLNTLALGFALAASQNALANDFADVKEAKTVWDITTGDEKIFTDRIGLIKLTAEMLTKRGIKPEFVLMIHGPAAKFVTKSVEGTKFQKETIASMQKIQSMMSDIKDNGAKIDVCSIALHRGEIKNENVMPFAVIEDNVWENTIILQNKGYAYMPVF